MTKLRSDHIRSSLREFPISFSDRIYRFGSAQAGHGLLLESTPATSSWKSGFLYIFPGTPYFGAIFLYLDCSVSVFKFCNLSV
jgi:hypothetical protein